MIRQNKIFLSGILFLTLLLIGCGQDEPRTKLNREERKEVDQRFSDTLSVLKKDADFICDDLREQLYEGFVDSILELRLIEIDQIIND